MRKIVTAVAAVTVLLAGATSAQASCAESPEPSPHRFVGTVVDVEADGRLAHVVLNDGRRVEVHGGASLEDGSGSSVDRQYAVGGRYEFHPVNARSPFRDNACTATRQLSGPPVASQGPDDGDELPGWLPVDEQSWPIGSAVLAAAVAAMVALGVALRGRRRSQATGTPTAFMSRRSSGGSANSRLSSAETTSSTSP